MYKIMPELSQRPFVFLKFSSEKWILESLQKGNLYTNTLGYLKKLEEESEKRGMGDRNEGTLVLTQLNIRINDHDTGELFLKGFSERSELKFEEDLEKHIFCMCYLDFDNFKIIDEGKDYIKAEIVFTEKQKREFSENFGEHVLIISCLDFIENIKRHFGKDNIDWICDKVKYSDFSVNHLNRIESYMRGRSDKYFWKDTYFNNQREYRLVIINRDSTEHFQTNIGDMSSFSHLTTIDKLFNDGFLIELHFNPEKDLVAIH